MNNLYKDAKGRVTEQYILDNESVVIAVRLNQVDEDRKDNETYARYLNGERISLAHFLELVYG